MPMPMPWYPTLEAQKTSAPKSKSFVDAQTTLGTLFEGWEGSRLVLPSIEALSPVWKVGINPHLESIRSEYNSWVNQYVTIYFP